MTKKDKLNRKLTELLAQEHQYNVLYEDLKEAEAKCDLINERLLAKRNDVEKLREDIIRYNIMEYLFTGLGD